MMKKLALTAAIAATAMTAIPSAAIAQPRHGYYRDGGYSSQYRNDRSPRAGYYGGGYYGDRGGYAYRQREPRRYGRYFGQRCHDDGTTGAIIGAIAGGLLGSSVAGRGDRTVGALIGGGAGALIGHAIDSDDCRR